MQFINSHHLVQVASYEIDLLQLLQLIKELEEKEAVEWEEHAKVEKEHVMAEEKRRVRREIIYGNNYERYKVENIKKIKDYEFLNFVHMSRFGPEQPSIDEDYEDMCTVLNAVKNCMYELAKLHKLQLLDCDSLWRCNQKLKPGTNGLHLRPSIITGSK